MTHEHGQIPVPLSNFRWNRNNHTGSVGFGLVKLKSQVVTVAGQYQQLFKFVKVTGSPVTGKHDLQFVCFSTRAAKACVAFFDRTVHPQLRTPQCNLAPPPLEVTRGTDDGVVKVSVSDAFASCATVDSQICVHECYGRVRHGRIPGSIGARCGLPPYCNTVKSGSRLRLVAH